MRRKFLKNKKEVGYDMKNEYSMGKKRKKVYIWAIMPVVMMVMIIGTGGCRKTITGPRPPDNGNDIDYPFNVSNTPTQSYRPRIAIDGDGNVHILWMDGGATEYEKSYIYHREYSPERGIWSDIDTISDTLGDCWIGGAVSDIYGNIHVVWLEYKSDGRHTYYRELYSDGVWSNIVELTDTPDADQPVIAADSMGGVHVMWWSTHGYLYKYKGPNGEWEWRDTLGTTIVNPALYAKPDGSLIIVLSPWYDVFYYEHPAGGRWSSQYIVDTSGSHMDSNYGNAFYSKDDNRIYILWTEGHRWIEWRYKGDGEWSEVEQMDTVGKYPSDKYFFKYNGRRFLMCTDFFKGVYILELNDSMTGYKKILWLQEEGMAFGRGVMHRDGTLHIVWSTDIGDNYEVFYDEVSLKDF